MSCSLITANGGAPQGTLGNALAGTLVSSLHRLKDSENNDGAFFVWGDISVKIEGTFRLQFNLYEMRNNACSHRGSVESDIFRVYSAKRFPGMAESTFLTRAISEQGVRLRLRKEPRTLLRKRGPAHDDYQPRHYRTGNRQPNQEKDRQIARGSESQRAMQQREQGEVGIGSQVSRQYSQSSAVSWTPSSISYEEPSKRPRTGSPQGHSPILEQQHNPFINPEYPPHVQPPSFDPPYTQQNSPYGYTYQSPQMDYASRGSYSYIPRIGTSQSIANHDQTTSPVDSVSPTGPQSQQDSYSHLGMGPSSITRLERLGGTRYPNRSQFSPRISSMPSLNSQLPQLLGGMGGLSSSSVYGGSAAAGLNRNEHYPAFTGSGIIYPSTTSMGGFLGTRGPSLLSTTAPESLGSS